MMRATRRLSCAAGDGRVHRVAIVGGGPSGFYTAVRILREMPTAEVDVYEKLPVPFGLARYGVAPDHPEVKNVSVTFTEMVEGWAQGRIRFHGNVEVGGGGVSVAKLAQHFHQVVVATGADSSRSVGIPGEAEHAVPARELVEWYNGVPGAVCPRDLSQTKSVAVVGNGNVALDCARILLMPAEHLAGTDITSEALDALRASAIRSVSVAARRGVLNTAFTIKEFREMLTLAEGGYLNTAVHDASIAADPETLPRARKRLIQLVLSRAGAEAAATEAQKQFHVRYLRRPVEATAAGLVCEVMAVDGEEGAGVVRGTGVHETVPADLILTSVGYKSVLKDATLPFDEARGVVPSERATGRVLRAAGSTEVLPRVYCAGWVKNGPVGVILAAHLDGKLVGGTVAADAAAAAADPATDGAGHAAIAPLAPGATTWETWQAIQEQERLHGEEKGKAAEKFVSVADMLKAGAA